MERNVCGLDRTLRVLVAVTMLVLGYRYRDRPLGTLTFLVGSDLLATAVIQRCPMNALLGIDACRSA